MPSDIKIILCKNDNYYKVTIESSAYMNKIQGLFLQPLPEAKTQDTQATYDQNSFEEPYKKQAKYSDKNTKNINVYEAFECELSVKYVSETKIDIQFGLSCIQFALIGIFSIFYANEIEIPEDEVKSLFQREPITSIILMNFITGMLLENGFSTTIANSYIAPAITAITPISATRKQAMEEITCRIIKFLLRPEYRSNECFDFLKLLLVRITGSKSYNNLSDEIYFESGNFILNTNLEGKNSQQRIEAAMPDLMRSKSDKACMLRNKLLGNYLGLSLGEELMDINNKPINLGAFDDPNTLPVLLSLLSIIPKKHTMLVAPALPTTVKPALRFLEGVKRIYDSTNIENNGDKKPLVRRKSEPIISHSYY